MASSVTSLEKTSVLLFSLKASATVVMEVFWGINSRAEGASLISQERVYVTLKTLGQSESLGGSAG